GGLHRDGGRHVPARPRAGAQPGAGRPAAVLGGRATGATDRARSGDAACGAAGRRRHGTPARGPTSPVIGLAALMSSLSFGPIADHYDATRRGERRGRYVAEVLAAGLPD